MSADAWRDLKTKVQQLKERREITWATVAKESGLSPHTAGFIFSHDGEFPGVDTANKVDKWYTKQTGEKPAKKVRTQADRVTGPTQFRKLTEDRPAMPQLVGGKHPPADRNSAAGRGWRKFGLHTFDTPTRGA
jgi:hypothetical protein